MHRREQANTKVEVIAVVTEVGAEEVEKEDPEVIDAVVKGVADDALVITVVEEETDNYFEAIKTGNDVTA